ncbi:MAG: biphenyl 2,3-dioxygenase [Alphaproteobacteria bacterium]|nr:biphenyl 2,3-dioxygenase [Alphaproteobacteria bacterium]HCP01120.1 biphenyl 2,3-dioxygenase [Rhodospirillaceae bacterium]
MSEDYAQVPVPDNTPSPAYFAHIVLYTKNAPEMVDWYCKVLGARITANSKGLAFLTYDDEHHRVAIIQRDDLDDRVPNTVGLAHFAYTYQSLAELIKIYERLKEFEIVPYRQINHGPTTSLYYHDPDGNAVELQTDNFENVEALNTWFATGAFDREPIGVDIDMDELVERYQAGEPESDLKKPRQD